MTVSLCSRCGSENLDLVVNDGEEEILLCTECGHEQPIGEGADQPSPE